jgi:hypothetical protein
MMWTKTGDEYPDERLDLSDAAYRLEHVGLTYCNRLLLDGRLPKARLGLLPVPSRTRGPKVVGELLRAGRWIDDADAYIVVGFFETQPSREEVEAQRAYDAVRQRIRYERAAEGKSALRGDEEAAKVALFDARQRRRAAAASQREPGSTSHRESQRPAPSRSRPAPPRPNEGEGEGRSAVDPPAALYSAPAGGFREWAAAIVGDAGASEAAKAHAAAILAFVAAPTDARVNGTVPVRSDDSA